MLLANKHFTLAIGVDVHMTTLPPFNPIHPYIGLVFDISDYIPFMGCNTHVNKMKRGNSGTSGMLSFFKHIPIASPPFAQMPIIGNETINFFGSQKTETDGSLFSPAGYMLMSCNDVGIPVSLPSKAGKKFVMSLYAPTTFSIPIPFGSPVIVGGPYVPDFASLLKAAAMGLGFAFLGKILKFVGAVARKAVSKLNTKILQNIPGTKGLTDRLCKWGFEPVDLITGRVLYQDVDIELPGPLPLSWERNWYSDSAMHGALGHGTHLCYDVWIEEFPEDECIGVVLPDGRAIGFPLLTLGQSEYHRSEKLTLNRLEDGSYTLYNHEERLTYTYNLPKYGSKKHKLKTINNHLGHTIQFHYNNQGFLQTIIDSAGRHLRITNDEEGRILTVSHVKNQSTSIQHSTYNTQHNEQQLLVQYAYNAVGDLITITDAAGQSTQIHYQNHLMVKKIDRNGQAFYWKYDGPKTGAKCIHTWGDGGILEGRITYGKGVNQATNSLGQTTTYYYDENNLCTQMIDAEGNSTIYEYTEYNELYRVIDPEGNITGYHYDEQGREIGITQPNGSLIQKHYNEHGLLHMITDAEGKNQIWVYDEQNRVEMSISPDNQVTQFTYNEQHLVSQVKNAEGAITTLAYDEQGNLIQLTLPDGNTAKWVYDERGRCITSINPEGAVQSFTYDNLGRIKGAHLPDGNAIRLQYNAYDEVIFAQDNHHKVAFEYTPLGSLKMRQENGTRIHFNYDTEEQLTHIINEHGERYSFGRDKTGSIISETGFDGLHRKYHRSSNGNIIRTDKPGNQWTEYEYDINGNLVRTENHDGSWEIFNYNNNGQLTEATNEHCTIHFKRDDAGRIVQETCALAFQKSQAEASFSSPNGGGREGAGMYSASSKYDALGRRTTLQSNLGAQLQYSWDKTGNLSRVLAQQDQQQSWEANLSYNKLGLETERLLPGGIVSRWSYDKAGRPIRHNVIQGTRNSRNIQYRWSANDRLTHMVNDINKAQTTFGHDDFGNLAYASYDGLNTLFKTNDEVGNIYRSKDKTDRQYDKGGKLVKTNTAKYHYDEQGNLIEKNYTDGQQWKYEWQANGMLAKVIRPDKKQVQFTYDALGRRLSKTFDGTITRWVYDRNTPLHEWSYNVQDKPQAIVDDTGQLHWDKPETTDNIITWVFEEGNFKPAAKLINNKQYSIICDYLGTPVEMYDEFGTKTWECELDIYGRVKQQRGETNACPFRYQGQYEDVETGLYYNRFRYYSAEEGLYLSQDPIRLASGEYNFYTYVQNVNTWIDPYGLAKNKQYEKFAEGAEKGIKELTNPEKRAINSLRKRIAEHKTKLSSYKENPFKFDNKGFLKNAPSDEVREKIVNSRINHLENEIKAFEQAIDRIMSGIFN